MPRARTRAHTHKIANYGLTAASSQCTTDLLQADSQTRGGTAGKRGRRSRRNRSESLAPEERSLEEQIHTAHAQSLALLHWHMESLMPSIAYRVQQQQQPYSSVLCRNLISNKPKAWRLNHGEWSNADLIRSDTVTSERSFRIYQMFKTKTQYLKFHLK